MISFIGKATHIPTKWAALLVALAVTATGLLLVANIKPVFASYTNTYPWGSAPCAASGSNLGKTTGTGYWCSGYNWGENPCPSGDGFCTSGWLMNGYYLLDKWGEGFRNCVSYTAWTLNQVFNINTTNWGNGADWNTSALAAGYTDDTSPQIGDIAQWNSPAPWGHVAYVYNVVNSVAYYAEYNHPQDGTYQDTETSATQGAPDKWIHIGTVNGGSTSTSNLVSNGDFNVNAASWNTTASANKTQYPSNQNQASYEGAGYLATNSPQSGGSVYQDISLTISAGNMYCLEAEITSIGSSGGNGTLAIWLNGGNNSESSSYVFSNLPTAWTPFKTCVTARISHSTIRVQIYDNVGSPTIGIDAVDVHRSLVNNGELNVDASHWNTTASANMVQYPGNQNQASYEGAGYLATNSPQSGGVSTRTYR